MVKSGLLAIGSILIIPNFLSVISPSIRNLFATFTGVRDDTQGLISVITIVVGIAIIILGIRSGKKQSKN